MQFLGGLQILFYLFRTMVQQEQYHPRYPLLEKYYDDNHRGRKLEKRLEVE
jgi:hypothetical protein